MISPQMLLGTADPKTTVDSRQFSDSVIFHAKSGNKAMLFVALGSVAPCTANPHQFCVVGANPYIEIGTHATFPLSMGKYAHVDPETRLCYYQSFATRERTK
jgi:hypothetical protein